MKNLGPIALLLLTSLASLPALANNCDPFASYTCSQGTPNIVFLSGTGTTGQSVGILLGSNAFSVGFHGNKSFLGDDLLILAAAPNVLTGTVNGMAFTSLSSFPEGAAMGAIQDTWTAMGIIFNSPSFGYANVGTIGSAPISITATGVGAGTIFYGEVLDPTTGKILYITPNSEAGILQVGTTATPEPGSLALLGTGLAGLIGLVRRKRT